MNNLNMDMLVTFALGEGAQYLESGAISITTGKHTGRCPTAKRIELCDETENKVDWDRNNSIPEEEFDKEYDRFVKYKESLSCVYTQQVQAVKDWNYRVSVTLHTERACYAIFANNMFIPAKVPIRNGYTIYHFPSLTEEAQVLISLSKKVILISGTQYCGEIKKSIFTSLNYHLPERAVLPMHCSVNISVGGINPTIFFGLSGTGKTTLSSDVNRILVGDDEHGWTNEGLTNFENGCYAKTIGLSEETEPLIWEAAQKPAALLENVVIKDNKPDFNDSSITENGRVSYPMKSIKNSYSVGFIDSHPKNIVMLTCDAFGVLPPVSKLTTEQAIEHFLIGYTAKVAGTEAGVKEPVATFSACFGAPFMPLRPREYANLLRDKINQHDVDCWLVNTGWIGGPYGKGSRISLKHTRNIISLINNNSLSSAELTKHEYTDLMIPQIESIPESILIPEQSWDNLDEYKKQINILIEMFEEAWMPYSE